MTITRYEGILLVNKPAGWTSHDVCNFVKRRFKIAKVGHTGTLDPQATGVLVLLLGAFTKYSAQLMSFEKEYAGTMELGVTTSSQDGDGEVVEQKPWQHITEKEVREVIAACKGVQKQIPPMVSAVKKDGVRLYDLARKGKEVAREEREIEVYSISCDRIELPCVDFTVSASKGTYIRTLVHDMGQKLGTGAYLKSLCRIRNGVFHINDCVTIDVLKALEDRSGLLQYIHRAVPTVPSTNKK